MPGEEFQSITLSEKHMLRHSYASLPYCPVEFVAKIYSQTETW